MLQRRCLRLGADGQLGGTVLAGEAIGAADGAVADQLVGVFPEEGGGNVALPVSQQVQRGLSKGGILSVGASVGAVKQNDARAVGDDAAVEVAAGVDVGTAGEDGPRRPFYEVENEETQESQQQDARQNQGGKGAFRDVSHVVASSV